MERGFKRIGRMDSRFVFNKMKRIKKKLKVERGSVEG